MKRVSVPLLVGVICLLAASAASAQAPLSPADALAWLQRIATAARERNYVGTFVYQHGDMVETSQLAHMTDGRGEWEKLTTLDGNRCEVVRVNEELSTYHYDRKVVRIERRSARRAFPALVPEQLDAITDVYDVRREEVDRIAGYDAQVLNLVPKDAFRYGHKLWAEANTGLLVKARMTNDRHQVLEQFTFTTLSLNTPFRLDDVRPSLPSGGADWKIIRAWSDEAAGAEVGWAVRNVPQGFRKVMEMRRSKEGDSTPTLVHLVLSDGLATVSVFIEPVSAHPKVSDGAAQYGVINMFSRTLGTQRITAMGETPPVTVMQIANGTAPTAK